jgi:hypothetical protein
VPMLPSTTESRRRVRARASHWESFPIVICSTVSLFRHLDLGQSDDREWNLSTPSQFAWFGNADGF